MQNPIKSNIMQYTCYQHLQACYKTGVFDKIRQIKRVLYNNCNKNLHADWRLTVYILDYYYNIRYSYSRYSISIIVLY